MNRDEKLMELMALQAKCDAIRRELEIHPAGTVIFQASFDEVGDDEVVVEADGFGGAMTSVVEGNYPIDYYTKYEKRFPTETQAENAAEQVAFGHVSPQRILA
jgi:hypothetical protein